MARRRVNRNKFRRKGIYAQRSTNKYGTRGKGVVGRSRKYGAQPKRRKRKR